MTYPLQLRSSGTAGTPHASRLLAELQGVGVWYNRIICRADDGIVLAPGCLETTGPIPLWLNHREDLEVCSSVKLIDCFDALRFTVDIPDTVLGRRALREFEAGKRGASVGISFFEEVGSQARVNEFGETIVTIYSATLREISLTENPGLENCYAERIAPSVRREDEIDPIQRVLDSCTSEAERRFWRERAMELGHRV